MAELLADKITGRPDGAEPGQVAEGGLEVPVCVTCVCVCVCVCVPVSVCPCLCLECVSTSVSVARARALAFSLVTSLSLSLSLYASGNLDVRPRAGLRGLSHMNLSVYLSVFTHESLCVSVCVCCHS